MLMQVFPVPPVQLATTEYVVSFFSFLFFFNNVKVLVWTNDSSTTS